MSTKKPLPKPPTRLPLRGGPPVIYLRKLRFEKQRPDTRGDYPVYRCGEIGENIVLILRVKPHSKQSVESTVCEAHAVLRDESAPVPLRDTFVKGRPSQNPDTVIRNVLEELHGHIEHYLDVWKRRSDTAQRQVSRLTNLGRHLERYQAKPRIE